MTDALAKTETMADRVDFAMSQVAIVATMHGSDDGAMRWAVWDQNQDNDDTNELGIVWYGREWKEDDTLDKPYGEIYWKHRDFVARAAIAAMREPTEEIRKAWDEKCPGDLGLDEVLAIIADTALKQTI